DRAARVQVDESDRHDGSDRRGARRLLELPELFGDDDAEADPRKRAATHLRFVWAGRDDDRGSFQQRTFYYSMDIGSTSTVSRTCRGNLTPSPVRAMARSAR